MLLARWTRSCEARSRATVSQELAGLGEVAPAKRHDAEVVEGGAHGAGEVVLEGDFARFLDVGLGLGGIAALCGDAAEEGQVAIEEVGIVARADDREGIGGVSLGAVEVEEAHGEPAGPAEQGSVIDGRPGQVQGEQPLQAGLGFAMKRVRVPDPADVGRERDYGRVARRFEGIEREAGVHELGGQGREPVAGVRSAAALKARAASSW